MKGEPKYCPTCHCKAVSDGICRNCCFRTEGYTYNDPCLTTISYKPDKPEIGQNLDINESLANGLCPNCGFSVERISKGYQCVVCKGQWSDE